MSTVAALPWVPAIADGENLLGWFRRASRGLGMGASYLFRASGLDMAGRREIVPSGLGIDLSEQQAEDLAPFARSTPERMLASTLRRFDPLLDFSMLMPEDGSTVSATAHSGEETKSATVG